MTLNKTNSKCLGCRNKGTYMCTSAHTCVNNELYFPRNLTKDFIEKLDLDLGAGLCVKEEDYELYVKGNEFVIGIKMNFGYIYVLRDGMFQFSHYGLKGLSLLKPSTYDNNPNLTFCEGLYCYDSNTHIPQLTNSDKVLYCGTYTGKYLECVFDCDPEEGKEKDKGSTKEYILLTNKPIEYETVLNKNIVSIIDNLDVF